MGSKPTESVDHTGRVSFSLVVVSGSVWSPIAALDGYDYS
jgi:hypothetical protein